MVVKYALMRRTLTLSFHVLHISMDSEAGHTYGTINFLGEVESTLYSKSMFENCDYAVSIKQFCFHCHLMRAFKRRTLLAVAQHLS